MSNHNNHEVRPFAEVFDVKNPKVHAGIGWCNDCQEEVVPDKQPARVI